jgi:DHA2 family multidrug resistance protein-like MFS transporter
MVSTTAAAVPDEYRGTDKLIFGIVLAVITFWLFAQTTLNVADRTQRGSQASGLIVC